MISFINTLFTKFKSSKEFRIVLFFNLVSVFGALAANKLITEYVEPTNLGELLLYMNLASLLTIPVAAFYLYFMHIWPQALINNTTERLRTLVKKITIFFILFSAILVTTLPFLNLNLNLSPMYLFFIWVVALGQASHLLISPILHAERRRKLAGLFDLCNGSLGRFGIIICLILVLHKSEILDLLQFQVVYSIFIFIMAISIFNFIKKNTNTEFFQHTLGDNLSQGTTSGWLAFVIPGFVTALTTQLVTASERWILSHNANLDSVSYFVLALGLCTAASSSFASLISNYYYPLLTGSAARNNNSDVNLVYRKYMFLTALSQAILLLLFVFASEFLTDLFFNKNYSVIKTILPILFFGVGIGAIANSQNVKYYTKNMTLIPNVFKVVSSIVYIATIYYGHVNNNISLTYLSWSFVASQTLFFLLMQSRINN